MTPASTKAPTATDTDRPPLLAIRIASIEHVLVPPGPLDRAVAPFLVGSGLATLPRVPVIRIFGAVRGTNQRACLHVHNVFPYLLVPYPGADHDSDDTVATYIHRLGIACNAALSSAASFHNAAQQQLSPGASQTEDIVVPPYRAATMPTTGKSRPHIAAILPVRALPFYGYHDQSALYLKIHLVDPANQTRLARMLTAGAILGTQLQAHEAHIPYLSQFLADHALEGMGWIEVDWLLARPPLTATHNVTEFPRMRRALSQLTCSGQTGWSPTPVTEWDARRFGNHAKRATWCELELDTTAANIVNFRLRRAQLRAHHLTPPSTPAMQTAAATPQLAASPSHSTHRHVPALAAIWDEEAQRRAHLSLPAYSLLPPPLRNPSSASPWDAEESFRKEMHVLFSQRRQEEKNAAADAEHGIAKSPLAVPRIQDSVSLLWPTSIRGDLACAVQANVLVARDNVPTTVPLSTQPFLEQAATQGDGGDADVDAYPDLVQFTQLVQVARAQTLSLSQMDPPDGIGDIAPLSPPSRSQASEILKSNDDEDGADMHQLLQWLLDEQQTVDAPGGHSMHGGLAFDDETRSDGHDLGGLHSDHDLEMDADAAATAATADPDCDDADAFDLGQPAVLIEQEAPEPAPLPLPSPHRETPTQRAATKSIPQYDGADDDDDDDEVLMGPPRKRLRVTAGPTNVASTSPLQRRVTFSNHTSSPRGQQPDRSTALALGHGSSPKTGFKRAKVDDSRILAAVRDVETLIPAHNPLPVPSVVEGMWSPVVGGGPALNGYGIPDTSDLLLLTSQEPPAYPSGTIYDGIDIAPPESVADVDSPLAAAPHCAVAGTQTFTFTLPPPTHRAAENELAQQHATIVHSPPYYGHPCDQHIAIRPRVFAGREYRIPYRPSSSSEHLPPLSSVLPNPGRAVAAMSPMLTQSVYEAPLDSFRTWTLVLPPPSRQEAVDAFAASEAPSRRRHRPRASVKLLSQVEIVRGDTQAPSPDIPQFATPGQAKRLRAELQQTDFNQLLCLSAEIHVNTRGELFPDPQHDQVLAIFLAFYCDSGLSTPDMHFDWLILTVDDGQHRFAAPNKVHSFPDERSMMRGLVELVRTLDPDVLVGYELHSASWGYLIERCNMAYQFDLTRELSRVVPKTKHALDPDALSEWGFRKTSSFTIPGRLILNVWRLLRGEVALTNYSLESTCAAILKKRIPHFSTVTLTRWYTNPATRYRVITYNVRRTLLALELLVTGEYLGRTSEFARVFGIDFTSVLTRGSQYRVEAMLVRIARPLGFVLVSPTKEQVAGQRGSECIPLVMEPESAFYPDPVIVLDFQSLYPSIMIAYNLCFSTCLGKLIAGGEQSPKLGAMIYRAPDGVDVADIDISPTGIMFLKQQKRRSVLAMLLEEILDTRVMIKHSMKLYSHNKNLLKILDARQLSLKLIANVTYGYCAASYSGRMPMVELGDSITQSSRETLEKAIRMIDSHPTWGARVVYGDTDSMFVHLKGATREQAFELGNEIASAVTCANPAPITLRFEKVYLPSILVTKKRYIGHKYESIKDTEPVFDAKGIETVRRDGCPLVSKMMRSALEILFVQRDLSKVKEYVERQFSKLLSGQVPLRDLIIAKEVRLGNYSDRVLPPPGAHLVTQKMQKDPRAVPQYGERIPFVVTAGAPGDRLIDQVMCPRDVLKHREIRFHAQYYIQKQVLPALSRLFQLFGADIAQWYYEMPKPDMRGPDQTAVAVKDVKRVTLHKFYQSARCVACDRIAHRPVSSSAAPAADALSIPFLRSNNPSGASGAAAAAAFVCTTCQADPRAVARSMMTKIATAQQRYAQLQALCTSCVGMGSTSFAAGADVECDSLACEVLYDRIKATTQCHELTRLGMDLGLV
ncbi:hypothetical protein BC828DRAFT_414526 [Blastocladiella britannica]|nr:hypothetical protein BC828DRAFT_414526 [Blastocladiella britannica]